MGLRSSCEASATKRRWRSTEASSAVSVSLVVRASLATSSWVLGSGTRLLRSSEAVMAAISRRMPSTGFSARRVTSQVTPPTTTSRAGTPMTIATVVARTALCCGWSEAPAWTR